MWHLKTTVIPVVIGALGMIKRKSEDHIKQIPGNPCLQELQKIFCGVYYPCDQKYCCLTIKRLTIAKCYSYQVHKTYFPLPWVMGYNSTRDCTQWKASNISFRIIIITFDAIKAVCILKFYSSDSQTRVRGSQGDRMGLQAFGGASFD